MNEMHEELTGDKLQVGDQVVAYWRRGLATAEWKIIGSGTVTSLDNNRAITNHGWEFVNTDKVRILVRPEPAIFECHASAMMVGDRVLRFTHPGVYTYEPPLVVTVVTEDKVVCENSIIPRFTPDGKRYLVERPGWTKMIVPRGEVRVGDAVIMHHNPVEPIMYWTVEEDDGDSFRGTKHGPREITSFNGGCRLEYLVLRPGSAKSQHWNGTCRCGKRTFTLFTSVEHEGACPLDIQ